MSLATLTTTKFFGGMQFNRMKMSVFTPCPSRGTKDLVDDSALAVTCTLMRLNKALNSMEVGFYEGEKSNLFG